jgi:hypothetical protein
MSTKPHVWEINEEGGRARHVESGIEVYVHHGREVLHVQTDPEGYGLDIPLWMIAVLGRMETGAKP